MGASKKPGVAEPVDQFISLIKTSDQKEVAAQKTVAKGSVAKKIEDAPRKQVRASTSTGKGTKAPKAAAKSFDNDKAPIKETADTEPTAKKNPKKIESPSADRPTSAWPFPSSLSSGSKS